MADVQMGVHHFSLGHLPAARLARIAGAVQALEARQLWLPFIEPASLLRCSAELLSPGIGAARTDICRQQSQPEGRALFLCVRRVDSVCCAPPQNGSRRLGVLSTVSALPFV